MKQKLPEQAKICKYQMLDYRVAGFFISPLWPDVTKVYFFMLNFAIGNFSI
jgi:hypothetical protein